MVVRAHVFSRLLFNIVHTQNIFLQLNYDDTVIVPSIRLSSLNDGLVG